MSITISSEALRAFPTRPLTTFRIPPTLLQKLTQKGFLVLQDIAHLRAVDISKGISYFTSLLFIAL